MIHNLKMIAQSINVVSKRSKQKPSTNVINELRTLIAKLGKTFISKS